MKTHERRGIARRNLVAGAIFGITAALVAGAWAAPTFTKMVAGKAASAADVNKAHQDLANAIGKLETRLNKLDTSPDCPRGYTKDAKVTDITVCKRGADEMVKVGEYWIDRYESSLVDKTGYAGGTCNGAGGKQYGAAGKDDYPAGFPDSGDWQPNSTVHACSVKGNMPSGYTTWFQAQQACLLAGKHLCTNEEWQGAAAGTRDPGSNNGALGGPCNTNGSGWRKTGNAGSVPGASASCISRWGAEDMIGNLQEWVSLWTAGSQPWMSTNQESATPWPLAYGYGDGKDETWNVNGRARGAPSGYFNGLPSVAVRGGYYASQDGAGTFNFGLNTGPTHLGGSYATRCCRSY